jgi:hypothetical protein
MGDADAPVRGVATMPRGGPDASWLDRRFQTDVLQKTGRLGRADQQGGFPAGAFDLGEGRIAAMDAAGIDVQILSCAPGPEIVEPLLAVELTTQANDTVAAAVAKHPDRFLGFATLPMRDPTAAATELERAVRELGFVGALINGHVSGRYLDDTYFWPVFESAETLGVPIYLHPTVPPQPVIDACYGGFAPAVSAVLSTAGSGWHIDTGIHCLRLILGGVFDRFSKLQIIVGHQFEALSWMAWRVDFSFPRTRRAVNARSRNTFGTTSTAGSIKAARQFFDQMPINCADKEKIAHLNAERLLRLSAGPATA